MKPLHRFVLAVTATAALLIAGCNAFTNPPGPTSGVDPQWVSTANGVANFVCLASARMIVGAGDSVLIDASFKAVNAIVQNASTLQDVQTQIAALDPNVAPYATLIGDGLVAAVNVVPANIASSAGVELIKAGLAGCQSGFDVSLKGAQAAVVLRAMRAARAAQ